MSNASKTLRYVLISAKAIITVAFDLYATLFAMQSALVLAVLLNARSTSGAIALATTAITLAPSLVLIWRRKFNWLLSTSIATFVASAVMLVLLTNFLQNILRR
jgi:CHASE2 domain-containing sensor protein